MIDSIIIDDEEHNRNILKTLLVKNCPNINIVAESDNADDAFEKLNKLLPKLVFLDIRMPGVGGFDLLKRFDEIPFEVIFVTAFDMYAIRAFEFNALGYVLKPVDSSKLIKAVNNAMDKIDAKKDTAPVMHFVKTLSDKNELINKLSVHHNDRVMFIDIEDIASLAANGGQTIIQLTGGQRYYSSKELCKFELILERFNSFVRINKSTIVNSLHIQSYTKGEPVIIEMKNGQTFEISRRRKTEISKLLRLN